MGLLCDLWLDWYLTLEYRSHILTILVVFIFEHDQRLHETNK